jgi:hypothetical protein
VSWLVIQPQSGTLVSGLAPASRRGTFLHIRPDCALRCDIVSPSAETRPGSRCHLLVADDVYEAIAGIVSTGERAVAGRAESGEDGARIEAMSSSTFILLSYPTIDLCKAASGM